MFDMFRYILESTKSKNDWKKGTWQMKAISEKFNVFAKPSDSPFELIGAIYGYLYVSGMVLENKTRQCRLDVLPYTVLPSVSPSHYEEHVMTYRIGDYEIHFDFTIGTNLRWETVSFSPDDIRNFGIRSVRGQQEMLCENQDILSTMHFLPDVPPHMQESILSLAPLLEAKRKAKWEQVESLKISDLSSLQEKRKRVLSKL